MLRGVRGATTADVNDNQHIRERTAELLAMIREKNNIEFEDVGAVIFSATADLTAAFPAQGARDAGWDDVPLFGTQEIDNPSGPPRCIRVLVLWNTDKPLKEVKHVYLREAMVLRPDLVQSGQSDS